jgi:hypothetical protein
MSQWYQDMPSTVLPAIRSFFELELLYSYVYMLSPSPRVPHIHEYAQRLIFEHCIAYATNLLALISQPSHGTKPPITFYDAMRAYMTGRQFVDVLSRNLDVILDPVPPTPPAPSGPPSTSDDPLAPPLPISAPPFPAPVIPDGQSGPQHPTQRAINAINDFTDILSRFGLRFGFTHWRDRFQRESGALSSQLYHRASQSPAQTPPSQGMPSHPTFFSQTWLPASSPPQQAYQQHPTTPPSAYPPQPSPFSTSPFAASPYSAPNQQQPVQDWTSPSPQPPDMPQPTEGRVRQALILGPGIPQNTQGQHQGQGGTPDGRFM